MIKDKTNILERLALMAWNHDGEENKTLMDAISIISNQQEIVRCKDCKYLIDHYGFMDDGYCENMRETYGLKFKPEDDWFCADGRRKE